MSVKERGRESEVLTFIHGCNNSAEYAYIFFEVIHHQNDGLVGESPYYEAVEK